MLIINRHVIAKNLRKKRIERGLTQEDLAEKINTSQKTISRIESAKDNSIVDLERLNVIAQALECKVDDFCYIEENAYVKEN